MSKVLISYATMSGNTQKVAEYIAQELPKNMPEVEAKLIDMMELTEEQFVEYDLVIVGSSTWTDGDYNPISLEFFSQIQGTTTDFSKVRFAIFGLGESYYPEFCTVVDKMAQVLKSKNGVIVGELLKLDGYVDDNMLSKAGEWAINVIHAL